MTMKDEFMEKKREEGRVRGRERERAHYSKRCKDTWTQETEPDKSRVPQRTDLCSASG